MGSVFTRVTHADKGSFICITYHPSVVKAHRGRVRSLNQSIKQDESELIDSEISLNSTQRLKLSVEQ